MPTIRLYNTPIAPAPGFDPDGDAAEQQLTDEVNALRQYLPREPMLLYTWYLGRAFHPSRPHDGLDGVCKRIFGGDRMAINRAYRRLIAWGLIEPLGKELLVVNPPSYTHRGKAALR